MAPIPLDVGAGLGHKTSIKIATREQLLLFRHRAPRAFVRLAATPVPAAAAVLFQAPARAQSGEPIKIGFGMALTGPLAPNGKSALLAIKIWEEDVNAKGG